jgi:hypothetical protein
MYELKDKLFELENNQPTFGRDHINFILHDFESLKNRVRKIKNRSDFSEYEVFNNINGEINQLQKDLNNCNLKEECLISQARITNIFSHGHSGPS